MLTVRYARQTRVFLSPPSAAASTTGAVLFFSSSTVQTIPFLPSYPFFPSFSSSPITSNESQSEIHKNDVVHYFREWFMSRKKPLFESIFEILRTQDESSADSAISRLNLRLSETLVLDVLNYEKKDVLSCLRFFDWAGRQPGFHHTRATFNAIFSDPIKSEADELNVGLFTKLYETEGYFDVVETVAKEIRARGFQNEVTHSIMMKSFCKQNQLERGAEYLRGLAQDDRARLSGIAVGTLVDALDLVKAGKLDGALEFLKDKQAIEGYVPDVFRYNMLICRLLRESRIEEIYDLLVDMKEREVLPNDVTMNAILCFLCKAGRMDIAMDLYNSRAEFGLSVNCMLYNYLINTLLGDVSIDEAYRLLRISIEEGYFPGEKTFSIIADALCREGKLDKMKELVLFTLDQNIMPNIDI
ncbi:UNVERIFIED_CONTAM: Pentatricopeptide repeat-containing protein, mitochondrial [Sesamum latifolium]|uniref:Pentatricopeptide repeat-containing protein, mitochondrial n=1 Tax=Sesamum latifolium TaxID=2727402 RepID=A0AAW2VCW7_9LAMI